MEKVIFFALVIPIFIFVLYLGGTAIMKGFQAKSENKSIKQDEDQNNLETMENNENLSDELKKLNELHQSGVLTDEEFEKAKKKILQD